MGIVALVVLSVTVAWAAVFGGLNPSVAGHLQRYYWNESGRALSRMHAYQPPARKSMVVDISGMAHPTADNTRMTKRDRSTVYPKLEVQKNLNETSSETNQVTFPPGIAELPDVPKTAGTSAPLFQMQAEEIPLAPLSI